MIINDTQGEVYKCTSPDAEGGLTLQAVAFDQIRHLPTFGQASVTFQLSYNAGSKSITIKGWPSAKIGHQRILQGAGVTGSGDLAQRVLTGSGTITVTHTPGAPGLLTLS